MTLGEFYTAMSCGYSLRAPLAKAERRLSGAILEYHRAMLAAVADPHDRLRARRLLDARSSLADAKAYAEEFCLPTKEEA